MTSADRPVRRIVRLPEANMISPATGRICKKSGLSLTS
jgi:hypothetical protein